MFFKYQRKVETDLTKASVDMARTKSERLNGVPYICILPENGWSPQKISQELDMLMGLGDLKGITVFITYFLLRSLVVSNRVPILQYTKID